MGESFLHDDVVAILARNEQLVHTIERHGGDLDEVRSIDFFFYANSHTDAQRLAADLDTRGFETFVPEEAVEGKWSVQAVRSASVTEITDPAFVEEIVRLTSAYLAEFDGWGTAI
ncbi:MAG TPA: ribonuclease E inhibitor RraB [Thermoanaerobaculia bacterium]